MTQLLIAADQHHKGGMEKILEQFGFDKRYHFLGDITPHYNTFEEAGKDRKAKRIIKEIQKKNPDLSYDEILKLYIEQDIIAALEAYGNAPHNTAARLRFLEENGIHISSIAGNVDLLIDGFLRLIHQHTGFGIPTSLDLIKESDYVNFLHSNRIVSHLIDESFIFEVPYSLRLNPDGNYATSSEHVLILTHENPHPGGTGENRKVKMQKSLDFVIDNARDANKGKNILLACGHLHVSGEPYEYRGITIVPLNADEVMEYNCQDGNFKVVKADNH